MVRVSRLRLRFRSLLHRDALDRELEQELAFHLAEQKAEFLAQGMTESEADAAARHALGPATSLAEECREQRRTRWLEDFLQDARYACRGFAKSPAFALVAVLTLALGIGANTAFFSAAYGILFRPLPYRAPERLVDLEDGIGAVGPVIALREMAHAAEYAGYLANNDLNLQLAGEAVRARATAVTWNLAQVLGVAPARGRWFVAAEERAGNHRVAVLSDRTWRERFSADPAILGRRIVLNEEPFTIAGVMPPGFAFPTPDTELWIPIRIDPRDVGYMWGGGNLWPIGRLREAATLAAAQAELGPAVDRIRAMFPWRMPDAYARSARVVGYSESLARAVRPKLIALSAAALLLLLIACGNVANLLLARSVRREREFAMREALGAQRGRLLRQLMAENLVIAAAGGAAGLLAAALILKSLPALLPDDTPRLHETGSAAALLLAASGSMVLTIVLFSAAPLFRLWRSRCDRLIGRALTASRRTSRISLALIGMELALATVLLIGAGLMGRTLARLAGVDFGFRTTGMVSARVSAGRSRCGSAERCRAMIEDLNQTLAGLPGVRSVNWSNFAPLEGGFSAVSSDIEDHMQPPGAPAFVLWQTAATPGYFRALGIPLRAGRTFTGLDGAGGAPVTVISASTARRFWPNESPIGKHVRPMSDREWLTVVGVVGDVEQYSLAGYPSWVDGVEYVPLAQVLPQVSQSMQLTLLVESTPPLAASSLVEAVRRRFPDVVIARVRQLAEVRSESVQDQRSTAWLLGLFAALGLVLGIAGVYGVIAHRASLRTREIGIRMALGASGGSVVRMVLRETVLVSAAGCLAGVAGAFGLSRFLQALLFGVTAHDAVVFTVCPAVLLAAAILAAAVPGLRASRTDPALTLREE